MGLNFIRIIQSQIPNNRDLYPASNSIQKKMLVFFFTFALDISFDYSFIIFFRLSTVHFTTAS